MHGTHATAVEPNNAVLKTLLCDHFPDQDVIVLQDGKIVTERGLNAKVLDGQVFFIYLMTAKLKSPVQAHRSLSSKTLKSIQTSQSPTTISPTQPTLSLPTRTTRYGRKIVYTPHFSEDWFKQ